MASPADFVRGAIRPNATQARHVTRPGFSRAASSMARIRSGTADSAAGPKPPRASAASHWMSGLPVRTTSRRPAMTLPAELGPAAIRRNALITTGGSTSGRFIDGGFHEQRTDQRRDGRFGGRPEFTQGRDRRRATFRGRLLNELGQGRDDLAGRLGLERDLRQRLDGRSVQSQVPTIHLGGIAPLLPRHGDQGGDRRAGLGTERHQDTTGHIPDLPIRTSKACDQRGNDGSGYRRRMDTRHRPPEGLADCGILVFLDHLKQRGDPGVETAPEVGEGDDGRRSRAGRFVLQGIGQLLRRVDPRRRCDQSSAARGPRNEPRHLDRSGSP